MNKATIASGITALLKGTPQPIETAEDVIRSSMIANGIPGDTARFITGGIIQQFGHHNLAVTYKYPSKTKFEASCDVCSVDVMGTSPRKDGRIGAIHTIGGGTYCSPECVAVLEPDHDFAQPQHREPET